MSVADVLSLTAASEGDPAVVVAGDVVTYADLVHRVDARVGQLPVERPSGSVAGPPGGIVPVSVEATLDDVVELLAIWKAGGVPAPLHARLTEPEVETARRALSGARLPAATQAVLWTSGTSGRPRGVALSWHNLEASARAAARRLDLGSDDVWVASLSPAHVGGLTLVTRSILMGGTLVLPESPDAACLSELLDGGVGSLTPTHLSLVPTQLLRLLDHRGRREAPPRLRCLLVGGAHTPASLVSRALDGGWPIALTYGATEMSSQIATSPPDMTRRVPGTVGFPLEGVEVRVGPDGEVQTRGPTLALGYVGRNAPELVGEDGWYRTGDLGRLDEEGRLWITGRRLDRIVSGGVTVDAMEVEEALRAHPTVVDACVVGIRDEEWGERVAAWVEPVVGEVDLEELERHLRERLAPAKRPRSWRVHGVLPKNVNGKVDRQAVRDAFEA